MTELTEKCKQVISELESKITDAKDLEVAKMQVYSLLETFLEEVEKIQEVADKRLDRVIQNQLELDKRISSIENDMYEEDGDFEIVCPYCNHEFAVEYSEIKDEITCPECSNPIELDWNEEHECGCGHGDCGCHHHECGDDGCDCED